MRHIVMLDSGIRIESRDGTLFTFEQVDAAEKGAALGDPEAIALLESLELPDTLDIRQLLHDCPECRAAMERGEQPMIFEPESPRAGRRKPRRQRWRDQKKRPH